MDTQIYWLHKKQINKCRYAIVNELESKTVVISRHIHYKSAQVAIKKLNYREGKLNIIRGCST